VSRLLNIRTGVQWKLTLLVTALVLCTSASLFWYFARNERQSQLESLLIYGRSLARVLATNSEDAVFRQDSDALRKTVERTSREPDVVYASVSDSTGRFRVQAGATPAPDVGGNASAPAEQQVGEALFDISAPVARKRLDFTASEPSDLQGAQQTVSDTTLKPAGVARVGLSLARADAAIEERRLVWILITLLLAAIGGGATHLLVTRLASVRAPTPEDSTSESDWEHEAELRSRELRESLDQQAATSAILRIIASSASDLQPALDAVAEHAARLCGATDAQIYLVTGADLQWIAGFGPLPVTRAESVPIRPALVSGKAILERCSVHIQDAARELEEFPDSKLIRSRIGYRTMLVTPLLWQGTAIGVIIIRRMQMHPFSDTQIQLLKTFADQSAIAIENTRLFHELRVRNQALTQALDQQTASTEVLRAISSSPTNLQRVLDEITRNAAKLCDAVDAYVVRVEDDTFVVTSVHGSPLHLLTGERLPLRRDLVSGRAILEARTVHVPDILAEPDTDYAAAKAIRSRSGYRTMLAAPLLQRGAAIGAISVGRQDVRPFTEEQVRLLESFADQAVIAIENTRLFEDLEARNRALTEALERQAATGEVLQIISSSPSELQAVFDAICRSSVRLCDGLNADLYQFDGEFIHFSAHANFTPEALEATRQLFPVRPNRDSAVARAIFDGDVVHIPDVTKDLDYRNLRWASTIGVRSALAVPMVREGRAIGVIAVNKTEPTPFSETQIELLKTFAQQAVIAIQNASLFEELQNRNEAVTEALEQQTATSEILRVISSSPTDPGPVFQTIVRSASRLCDAEFAVLHRYDGERVSADAYDGLTEQEIDVVLRVFPRPAQRDYAAGRAILDRGVVHIPDIHEDPEYQISDSLGTTGYTAVLAVPLLKDGTAVGALCLWRRAPYPFSETQIALVHTFADQAVIAIENVRLFNELGERNKALTEALDQQTATSEVLRVFSSSPTDIKPVLEAVVRSAARLCHAKHAIIFQVEGDFLRAVKQYGALSPIAEDGRLPIRRDLVAGRAVIERRTMHFADILAEPKSELASAQELAVRMGYRTVVAAPLMRQVEPAGVLGVWRTEVQPFSDSEVALLETFADQAVIAIENVRLFNELQDRNKALTEALEQQTATSDILRVISSSPTDLQPVLDAVAASASRLSGGSLVSILRIEGDALTFVAESGPVLYVPLGQRLPIGRDVVAGRAIIELRPIHVADIQAESDAEYATAKTYASVGDYRAILAVPLMREGEPLGVLVARRREAGLFSDTQVALMQTFADQAVIATENVRLFQELETRTQQLAHSVEKLQALAAVSEAINSTLDLQKVLETMAACATQLSSSSAGAVYEFDEESQSLRLRATHGVAPDIVEVMLAKSLRLGEGVNGRAALERVPVQVDDIRTTNAYSGVLREIIDRSELRAVLVVPMLREGRVVGTLSVSRKTTGSYPLEVAELLQTVAAQSTLAIQNARLFRQIERKSRELLIASQHKSQFLANMSHELRTPLNAILGYTELIVDKIYGDVPEQISEVLERVQKSGRHLLALINEVLDLSKIEAGQLTLELSEYSFNDVAQAVVSAVGSLAAEKQLLLSVNVAADLPVGRGDERRITQVLLNLVGNAIKFTEKGEVAVRVSASAGTFLVAVRDTGPGIREEDRQRIFEEFQQSDSSPTKTKGGTGLGLAIAKRIVEMHGGRIWVDSSLGHGSTFFVSLPVRVEREEVEEGA
jgi:GAF domain-containing protein/anti-sigma regulatory factor (Ser/Thr protein kinase)